tara:strand:- start:200 stop:334 length:135 start_codon:yes stop_codon:yes gene_type:complete
MVRDQLDKTEALKILQEKSKRACEGVTMIIFSKKSNAAVWRDRP